MDVCTINRLFTRSTFTDNVSNTAKSFKSWHTCMDNTACKVIAIVGICLAALVFIWLVGALLTCCRAGGTDAGNFWCWCCMCSSRSSAPRNDGMYGNSAAAMPATVVYQPIQQPESAYYRNRDDMYYDERAKSNDVFELEEDFDLEKQREKSKNKNRLPVVAHDIDEEQSVYQPANTYANNPWQSMNDSLPHNTNSGTYAAQSKRSPYPTEDAQSYQGYNYYHGGYER